MNNWFTFTLPVAAAEIEVQLAQEDAFKRLWQNVLLRDPDTCLFAGTPGPAGLRFYMAVPEATPVQEYVQALDAEQWMGTPSEPEGVRLIVGEEQCANALWEERNGTMPNSGE